MWSSCYLYLFPYKIIHHSCYRTIPQLNEKIFEILRIKHSVSSACQQQTNRQVMDCRRQYMHVLWLLKQTNIIKYISDLFWNMKDGRTNMRHVRKYVNENDNNWDLHLPAVVYGINTALQVGGFLSVGHPTMFFFLILIWLLCNAEHIWIQASTRHTPFFLMFHRHPRLPVVMNACPMGDAFEVGDPEEDIGATVTEMKALNDKVSAFSCTTNIGLSSMKEFWIEFTLFL